MKMEASGSCETFITTRLYGVTSKKTLIFIVLNPNVIKYTLSRFYACYVDVTPPKHAAGHAPAVFVCGIWLFAKNSRLLLSGCACLSVCLLYICARKVVTFVVTDDMS